MTPAESRVEISRRFAVPRERIFAAFASAERVARWLTPSPDISLKVLSYDFRERGTYRFEYRAPGGQVMRVHGTFIEVLPPARIVFSWIIEPPDEDRKSTRLNSSHLVISYAVFCLKKK